MRPSTTQTILTVLARPATLNAVAERSGVSFNTVVLTIRSLERAGEIVRVDPVGMLPYGTAPAIWARSSCGGGLAIQVFHLLLIAALRGEECPSNPSLRRRLRRGRKAIADAFAQLEAGRFITVERVSGLPRRVTIVPIDVATAVPDASNAGTATRYDQTAMVPKWLIEQDAIAGLRIEPRDPCFKCGARGDLGCAHRSAVCV